MGNAEVFVRFLRQLMVGAQYPTILVIDGHSIHKSNLVKAYVEETAGLLELAYLPQLNPDEQVWKHVKAEIAKKPIANKFDFRLAVDAALLRLQSMKETIAAFFRHPECGFV
jgi:transposase